MSVEAAAILECFLASRGRYEMCSRFKCFQFASCAA